MIRGMKFLASAFIFIFAHQAFAGSYSTYLGRAKLLNEIKKEKHSKLENNETSGRAKFLIIEVKQQTSEESCPRIACGGISEKIERAEEIQYRKAMKPHKGTEFFFKWTSLCGKDGCKRYWRVVSENDFKENCVSDECRVL